MDYEAFTMHKGEIDPNPSLEPRKQMRALRESVYEYSGEIRFDNGKNSIRSSKSQSRTTFRF